MLNTSDLIQSLEKYSAAFVEPPIDPFSIYYSNGRRGTALLKFRTHEAAVDATRALHGEVLGREHLEATFS